METPNEGERDSLLRDVNSSTSDEVGSVSDYGIQNEASFTGKKDSENWEFAGHGTEVVFNNLVVDEKGFEAAKAQKYKHALGQLVSTAISGTLEHSVSSHPRFIMHSKPSYHVYVKIKNEFGPFTDVYALLDCKNQKEMISRARASIPSA